MADFQRSAVPGATWDAVPHRLSQSQAQEFLAGKYCAVEELRPLGGGFWSSAYSFSHAGRELVLRFGANKDWFEADRAALAFASPDLPVPEFVEVGEAFDGAYAISVRCYGINLEDVRPDQSDAEGPMLASLLAALFKVPKSSDLTVGWHWRPPRSDLTWRGWLSERLVDDPRQEVHGSRAALAVQSDFDRVYRAAEARVRDLIETCPERRDLACWVNPPGLTRSTSPGSPAYLSLQVGGYIAEPLRSLVASAPPPQWEREPAMFSSASDSSTSASSPGPNTRTEACYRANGKGHAVVSVQ